MNIEHSNQINDFLTFYIQTKIDSVLTYETDIDYYHREFTIENLITKESKTFKFKSKNENKVEGQLKFEIKYHIENGKFRNQSQSLINKIFRVK